MCVHRNDKKFCSSCSRQKTSQQHQVQFKRKPQKSIKSKNKYDNNSSEWYSYHLRAGAARNELVEVVATTLQICLFNKSIKINKSLFGSLSVYLLLCQTEEYNVLTQKSLTQSLTISQSSYFAHIQYVFSLSSLALILIYSFSVKHGKHKTFTLHLKDLIICFKDSRLWFLGCIILA